MLRFVSGVAFLLFLVCAAVSFGSSPSLARSPERQIFESLADRGFVHPILSPDPVVRHSFLWRQFFGRVVGAHPDAPLNGVGGGIPCVACTVLVAIAEQYAQIHVQSIEQTLDELCSFIPAPFKEPCRIAVKHYAPIIIDGFENEETADVICQDMRICTNATCHIFPPSHKAGDFESGSKPNVGSLPFIPFPLDSIANHEPVVDDDHDYFSTTETLRGASWRGKDCDDTSHNIYPGRKVNNFTAYRDHDCNGIYGIDPLTSQPYEDELCGSTQRYGIAILGDSAAAHFHVPRSYMNVSEIDQTTYRSLPLIAENEFDWPQMSATTGYTITDWIGTPGPPIESYYSYAKGQNLCSHRDFQNIGVNGARTSSMKDQIMYTLKRDQTLDHPLLLVYALIGNDVCNGHYGLSHMTTPQEFYANVVDALEYLDTILPSGSHVMFYGLVDGRILWNTMNARIHPIGWTNQDVTYADVYEYLNCLEISPCWGWLNSNATWRNATTERANQLNQVYLEIIANNTYEHFDMTYFPTPLHEAISLWESLGGQAWELIEPIDGFHPDQNANALLAQMQWKNFLANFTYLVPPTNPNNQKIANLFADQGGY